MERQKVKKKKRNSLEVKIEKKGKKIREEKGRKQANLNQKC